MSVDPLVGLTGEPYVYSASDPINGNDPLGLLSEMYLKLLEQILDQQEIVNYRYDAIELDLNGEFGPNPQAGPTTAAGTCTNTAKSNKS